jgi:hypothetical protein
MKKLLLTILMFALALGASAQSSTYDGSQFAPPLIDFDQINDHPAQWYRKGMGGITLSQVSLSNWAAGGEGVLAIDALLNYDAIYTNRRHLWQNRIELAYGLSNYELRGTRKTNDKIFLSSMYGYRLSQTWYASLLGTFSTQFAKGYDYSTDPKTYMSRFMAPGYLGLGAGFTWKPRSWFMAHLSPATWRGTFVFDDNLFRDATGSMVYAPYGVEPGRHLYNEFGANVRFEINRNLWSPNFHLYSRLDLFSNYLHIPQNVDVRWYVLLTAKISRWVSANLSFNMLYDDDIKFLHPDGTIGGSKLQFKEVLGIGFQTTF